MNLYVRNIDANVLKELDVKASKNGYRSRNEYIVKLLEGDAVKELNVETEDKYSNLVKAVANVVSDYTKRVNDMEENLSRQLTDIEMEIRQLK